MFGLTRAGSTKRRGATTVSGLKARIRATNSLRLEQLEARQMLTTMVMLPAEEITLRTATIGIDLVESPGDSTGLTLYWGTQDGGDDVSQWDRFKSFGTTPLGQYTVDLENLAVNQEYFYRGLSFNFAEGLQWSESASFSTLAPGPAAVESDPLGFASGTTVEVSGRVTETGGVIPVVAIYFGEVDGGDDPAQWQNRTELGEFDGEFAAQLTGLTPGTNYYVRFAADNGAGISWDATTRQVETPFIQPLRISEWMAANSSTVETRVRVDPEARFVTGTDKTYDWLEIQNSTNQDQDLGGYHLTDDDEDLTKWTIPANTIVPAGETMLFYASGYDFTDTVHDDEGILHTNFRLSRNGDYLALTDPSGAILHAIEDYPVQTYDASYGYYGDLLGQFRDPTPGERNGPIGPEVYDVEHIWENDDPAQAWTVTARVHARMSEVQTLRLNYRVMFEEIVTLEMNDLGTDGDLVAGDGLYTAVIPGGIASPGEMVRYYVTAHDELDLLGRYPLFPSEEYSPEYVGTMIEDTSVPDSLPVLYRFVEDPRRAETGRGTRASVYYDGEFYDNAFIRIRGGTARSWPKKSYKIEFNDGQHFRVNDDKPRVDEINVNTTYTDKTYLRAAMTARFQSESGTPAPETSLLRMHQNGEFFSVALMVEQMDRDFLRRNDLDTDGSLYKGGPGANLASLSGLEKKTREYEDRTDLTNLIAGLNLNGDDLERYLFDSINIPAMVNFMATVVISQNIDASDKNYYLYRDTEGTGEWEMLPWDLDLTFGPDALNTDTILADQNTRGARNPNAVHPHLGSRRVTLDGASKFNEIQDRIINNPRTREMFHRRIRTMADTYLGTSYFYDMIDELAAPLPDQVAADRAAWGSQAHFPGRRPPHADEVQRIKDEYLPRRHIYLTNYQVHFGVGIPTEQPERPELQFGVIQAESDTGVAAQEYFVLQNPNSYAVDLSGWRLAGEVSGGFEPGTVIPSNGSLYLTPDVAQFRARETGPGGNQALFVQQYRGNLSDDRGRILILNPEGETISIGAYGGDLNQDGTVDMADLEQLCVAIRTANPDRSFDFDGNQRIDQADLTLFVSSILGTSIGDVNLDGVFDSSDLVSVFQAGEYEDSLIGNSTYSEGDWNCDGEFDTTDLVAAFSYGGFVAAARPMELPPLEAHPNGAGAPSDVAAAVDQLWEELDAKSLFDDE